MSTRLHWVAPLDLRAWTGASFLASLYRADKRAGLILRVAAVETL